MKEVIVYITGWHLTKPQSVLLHNAFLGKGLITTYSALAAAYSDTGFKSPYQARNGQQAKEDLWEKVRQQVAPDRPSRLGAFFLFETSDAANSAHKGWFANEKRVSLRVQAPPPPHALVHRADATWLNSPEADWPRAADCYWQGIATQDPFIELIVHGVVFFPDWEQPPFGPLTPSTLPLST